MCPSAPRVCSEPGGQRPVLSLSLNLIVPLGTNFSEISIRIQSFSFKNMRLKFSQRNFPSGDLLTYSTSRPIWYVRYVMRAKCWWPYLGHRTNSQCNRVSHNTLPHYAASRWLCYLFIAIPTSQGVPTNMIEISHLLLIALTECAQYIFCRRILPSAGGALVIIWCSILIECGQCVFQRLHIQITASAPSHPIQHPIAGETTHMTPVGLVIAGCW